MTSTDPVDVLEFELAWKVRDQIIHNLNQQSAILSGRIISEVGRENMKKANGDLLLALMNLPAKIGGLLRRFESVQRNPDEVLSEPVLELKLDLRLRIVNTLMINHHVALLGADSVSSDFKSKLIDDNKNLIFELLELKTTEHHCAEPMASEPQTISESAANEENLAELNDFERSSSGATPQQMHIEQLDSISPSDHTVEQPNPIFPSDHFVGQPDPGDHPIDKVAKIVPSRKSQRLAFEKFKRIKATSEQDPMESPVAELTFAFDAKKILAKKGSALRSETFYCGGIGWYLYVNRSGPDFMGVHLSYERNPNDKERWKIVATFELRLLSLKSGSDVFEQFVNADFNHPANVTAWEEPSFISIDRLRSGSFIKQDTIRIRVHLKIESFQKFE